MPEEFIIDTDDLQRRMDGALSAMKNEFASLRTGRASSSMLDPITLEAYGQRTPLNQLGTINVPEPRMVTVNVWDNSASTEVGLAVKIPVPNGSSFVITDTGKTMLETMDEIRVYVDSDNAIDVTASILKGVT